MHTTPLQRPIPPRLLRSPSVLLVGALALAPAASALPASALAAPATAPAPRIGLSLATPAPIAAPAPAPPGAGLASALSDTTDIVNEVSPVTLTVTIDGHALRVPYYANRALGQIHSDVTRAVVVLHGTLRNAGEYQASVVQAGQMAGGADATTFILTPQFLTEPDIEHHNLSAEHAYWAYMGWRKGDRSINTLQNPRPAAVSSFSVIDTILVWLAQTLPNLERIVLAGHSAGGQVSNLFTAASGVHAFLLQAHGVPVRAVVSNPSSYLYFNEERWIPGTAYDFAVPDAETIALCPGYDDYKYGLVNPNEYASSGVDSLRARYFAREAVYLLGGEDTNPNDFYLDTTCPAELQGSQRLERGLVYTHHLTRFFGPDIWSRQALAIVPGVGHDHALMFTSVCGLYHIFDYGTCAPPPPSAWVDVTPVLLGGEACQAAAWGDSDADGDPDLFLPATDETDVLARNDAGVFSDATQSLADPGTAVSAQWGDYDNDARPDLYVVRWQVGNRLYHNDGDNAFSDVTTSPLGLTGNCVDAAWADDDLDGDLDLFVTRSGGQGCRMFRNQGSGFTDATISPLNVSGTCRGAAWGDYDGDGDPDLYIAREGSDRLLRNDGDGQFTDVTAGGMNDNSSGYSAAWGDYDGDGDLDLYVVNRYSPNRLFRNEGGTFTSIQQTPVNVSANGRSASWADYDNDGRLDLYLCNEGQPNRLFRNLGDGGFAESTESPIDLGGASSSATWADYDGDGALDLYVTTSEGANHLFDNAAAGSNHWFQVSLRGTDSNASAIGARVRVLAGGEWQLRQVGGDAGLMAQNPGTVAFGLGSATMIDSVVVFWPSGGVQRAGGFLPDWRMTFVESEPPTGGAPAGGFPGLVAGPNPFRESTRLWWSGGEELPGPFGQGIRRGRAEGTGRRSPAEILLTIVQPSGRRVRTLRAPGPGAGTSVLWDGRDEGGRSVAAGVYLVGVAGGVGAPIRLVRVP